MGDLIGCSLADLLVIFSSIYHVFGIPCGVDLVHCIILTNI